MHLLSTNGIEKKAFLAGYECIALSRSVGSRDFFEGSLTVRHILCTLYSFLADFDKTLSAEYTEKCDMLNRDLNSELLLNEFDNAVMKVFENHPEITHTYFLSKICHFFLFGIRLDITSSIPNIVSSFDHLLALHSSYNYWPYSLELREALYTLYECLASDVWPPNPVIRHFYVCLAEIYQITQEDLTTTLGDDIPALGVFYESLFPQEYQDVLKIQGRFLNEVVFDDTVAFYIYLKTNRPAMFHEYKATNIIGGGGISIMFQIFTKFFSKRKNFWQKIKEATAELKSLSTLRKRADEVTEEYKRLPNLEKIKYVNLANSVTPDELDYVRVEIAALFESEMLIKAIKSPQGSASFLDAHR